MVRRQPGSGGLHDGRGMLTKDLQNTNGFDNFEKVHFWTTPTTKCASQNDQCVPYYRWVSDYIGVIGGR